MNSSGCVAPVHSSTACAAEERLAALTSARAWRRSRARSGLVRSAIRSSELSIHALLFADPSVSGGAAYATAPPNSTMDRKARNMVSPLHLGLTAGGGRYLGGGFDLQFTPPPFFPFGVLFFDFVPKSDL